MPPQPIGTDRGCGRCGEQIILETRSDNHYTSSLTELLELNPGEQLALVATCGCDRPRAVGLSGQQIDLADLEEFG